MELRELDELWFQVSGTLCNLECTHCFISCSPHNDSFGYLSEQTVARVLEESADRGIREYYFTGGEPFLNPEFVPIVLRTLEYGPVTILTNGTVLKPEWLERLRAAQDASVYGIEFRVSIDGPSPELNDPIRGPRTFERAMTGVGKLVAAGFLPIITMTRVWDEGDELKILSQFRAVLREQGYDRPRIKVLPRLLIGAEAERTCGYSQADRLTNAMMADFDESQLICSHSRVVTDQGIYVCPILLEEPAARLGDDLQTAETSFDLAHGACVTCYQYGAICTNPTGLGLES